MFGKGCLGAGHALVQGGLGILEEFVRYVVGKLVYRSPCWDVSDDGAVVFNFESYSNLLVRFFLMRSKFGRPGFLLTFKPGLPTLFVPNFVSHMDISCQDLFCTRYSLTFCWRTRSMKRRPFRWSTSCWMMWAGKPEKVEVFSTSFVSLWPGFAGVSYLTVTDMARVTGA